MLTFLYSYDIITLEVMEVEPMKVKKLPIDYVVDKELLRLLAEANSKYCEFLKI